MANLRQHLGAGRRRLLHWIDRRTTSLEELAKHLDELGLRPGRTVLVHSSMDQLGRRLPGVDGRQLLDLLSNLIGETGTLLMPTSPFVGSQEEYVRRGPVFNVRRTPSRLGLLSEIFRRLPQVERSLHPTHSVAGLGPRSAELLGQHHLGTAFGRTSPFYKLGQEEGLVLGLGVGVRQAFTIWHVVEEMHPPTQQRIFADEEYPLQVVDGERELRYSCRPLQAGLRRDFAAVEKALLKAGALHYRKPGGLLLAAAEGRAFIAAGLDYCQQREAAGGLFSQAD